MQRTGAQIVWECLVKEGVDVVFGYPGGAILPTYDAMLDYPTRHVLVRHEQGAAHMADGYARASGRVGVAIATSGPGATNLTTGIATAMLDSSPTVFITGQVSSKVLGTDAFQEVDVTGITLPITKHNSLVTDVRHIARTIKEAFVIARSGRPGPVLVDITKDAQQAKADFHYPDHVQLPGLHEFDAPDEESLAQRGELIERAERPIILAGAGVIRSGASQALVEFAEKAGVPVGLTLLGIGGFPQSHPLCLGMMGMHGEAFVNQAIQEADLLLAFGMRFDDRVTGNLKTYAPHAKKIHVEIDPSEIGKNVKVDVAPRRRPAGGAARADAGRAGEAPRGLDREDRRLAPGHALARHPAPGPQRPAARRARDERHLAHHRRQRRRRDATSASTRCGRRSTTSTTSRAR